MGMEQPRSDYYGAGRCLLLLKMQHILVAEHYEGSEGLNTKCTRFFGFH